MRIVFLGSGEFALPSLERLHALSDTYRLVRVITRPDRPAGRGKRLTPTPIRRRAMELGIPCDAPPPVNDAEYLAELEGLGAELYIVADYGELLGKAIRALPAIGMFNLHGSLLPRFRGAAPVAYAILAGDEETGVTLFRVERRLDSGTMVDHAAVKIEQTETAGELEERLAHLAVELLERNLPRFADGSFTEEPQDESGVTLAPKLEKNEARIDWQRSAQEVVAAVRAYNPWPGAFTALHRSGAAAEAVGERTTIWKAAVSSEEPQPPREPGAIIAAKNRLSVQCGQGVVEVVALQRPGKATMAAAAYLNGMRLDPTAFFGASKTER